MSERRVGVSVSVGVGRRRCSNNKNPIFRIWGIKTYIRIVFNFIQLPDLNNELKSLKVTKIKAQN